METPTTKDHERTLSDAGFDSAWSGQDGLFSKTAFDRLLDAARHFKSQRDRAEGASTGQIVAEKDGQIGNLLAENTELKDRLQSMSDQLRRVFGAGEDLALQLGEVTIDGRPAPWVDALGEFRRVMDSVDITKEQA